MTERRSKRLAPRKNSGADTAALTRHEHHQPCEAERDMQPVGDLR
jgi:hypothetical protein